MLKSSIKTNVNSILRNPATLLALLASIILCYMVGFQFYTGPSGLSIDAEVYYYDEALEYAIRSMMGFIEIPIRTMAFPFIGIIVANNLFKDKKNGMYDLVLTGQITFFKYFLSKLVSYYIISIILCTSMTLIYEIIYSMIQIPADANFEWHKVFIVQVVAMVVTYTSCLWIPIACSIFWTALTGFPLAGIIFNSIYRYIPNVIKGFTFSVWDHYVYVYPDVLYMYLSVWIRYPVEEWFTFKYVDPYVSESFHFYTSFKDAMIAYFIQIGIAVVLLTSSYFLLKKRIDKLG